ncbi:MAG TPA: histidine phosphatase family protein [Candidatus Kryptonia bacterium]|nr:histidine phosphatase family protein [Candidatus Kryptonia bacterium]
MRIVLVRHGETDGQSSVRYFGATDVRLSRLGRLQMECAAAALADRQFHSVYASGLTRARASARIVAGREPTVLSGFNEIDFGEWEGLTVAEIEARDPEAYAVWRERPAEFRYPGGESTAAFRARVAATLRLVLARDPGTTRLLVLHKGVIRTILAELLRLDFSARSRLEVDLGSIHTVERAGEGWRAACLNQIDHLTVLGQSIPR